MISRERVLTSLAHREPDRVAIDVGSNRSSGIMAIAYNHLKEHLGMPHGRTFVYDLVQQLAEPEQWFLDRFHVDVVDLGRAFTRPETLTSFLLPDGSPAQVPSWFRLEHGTDGLAYRDRLGRVVARMPKSSLYFDQTIWPLTSPDALDSEESLPEAMSQVIWGALPTSPLDQPLTGERFDEIAVVARTLLETTEYAITLPVGCNLFEWCQWLFGMENLYIYAAAEKAKLGRFLDRLVDLHLETVVPLLSRLKGLVHILVVGDDLGAQNGPQISPRTYRELFLPRHKRLYRAIKQASGARILLHSCGGIYELIPDLIEAGVDILNPVQTSARGMDPARLKREFGRDLVFWGGGCDTQQILPYGTPQQVRDEVRRKLDVFMPGGGFIWNQVHNIMADIPPENIVAMLDAAYEFGQY